MKRLKTETLYCSLVKRTERTSSSAFVGLVTALRVVALCEPLLTIKVHLSGKHLAFLSFLFKAPGNAKVHIRRLVEWRQGSPTHENLDGWAYLSTITGCHEQRRGNKEMRQVKEGVADIC